MCLIIKNHITAPEIASEDIPVFKLLMLKYNNRKLQLVSPYQKMQYKIGKTYKSQIKRNPNNVFEINEGLHSFISRKGAYRDHVILGNTVMLIGIIPKGSQYYIGTDDDVVSNKLKLIDIL